MAEWVLSVIRGGGYAGLAALAAIECLFPPIPSELIFPLAGYLAQQGQLTIAGCIVAGAVGNTIGSVPLYLLGRRVGRKRVESFVERHGRWASITPDELQRTQRWFDCHGGAAVLLAHLVPGLRSLIALPAGIAEMPLWRFVLFTLVGAAIWTAALVWLGVLLRENFAEVGRWLDPVVWVVLGGAVAAYVWRVIRCPGRRSGPPPQSAARA